MKKFTLILLLATPLGRADGNYVAAVQRAVRTRNWQEIYNLIDKKQADVNELLSNYQPVINFSIMANNLEATRKLLEKGANLNIVAAHTPLQKASFRYLLYKDNAPLITLLLEAGADPHATNTSGESTFDFIKKNMGRFSFGAERGQELIDLFNQYLVRKNIKPAKR